MTAASIVYVLCCYADGEDVSLVNRHQAALFANAFQLRPSDKTCLNDMLQDVLSSNFIKPLQGSEIATYDSNGKLDQVHCNLNINTETGQQNATA